MTKVPFHVVDQFHSALMDNDIIMPLIQDLAVQVADEFLSSQPCETDEEDVFELAMELLMRLSVS